MNTQTARLLNWEPKEIWDEICTLREINKALLVVLKNAINAFELGAAKDCEDACNEARAAIAKAEGRL